MTARRLRLLVAPALIAMLTGCGQSGSTRTPDLAGLPLVDGARIVSQVRQCDEGANAFCAWQLVVVGARYRSSEALLRSEHHRLIRLGWTGANADTGDEHGADSPGHKLRLTYATAYGDLKGIDLGWIRRSRQTTLALSRALFAHSSALSLMLEEGAT